MNTSKVMLFVLCVMCDYVNVCLHMHACTCDFTYIISFCHYFRISDNRPILDLQVHMSKLLQAQVSVVCGTQQYTPCANSSLRFSLVGWQTYLEKRLASSVSLSFSVLSSRGLYCFVELLSYRKKTAAMFSKETGIKFCESSWCDRVYTPKTFNRAQRSTTSAGMKPVAQNDQVRTNGQSVSESCRVATFTGSWSLYRSRV